MKGHYCCHFRLRKRATADEVEWHTGMAANKQEGTELLTFWSTSFSVEEREHMALSSTPIGKCSSHAAPYTDLLFGVPEPS